MIAPKLETARKNQTKCKCKVLIGANGSGEETTRRQSYAARKTAFIPVRTFCAHGGAI